MKKSLLFLASLLLSVASFAQWTQPVPTFVPMDDSGNTVQYLYNVEAGGFLVGANDWNTRASVSTSKGYKVKMEALFEDDEKTIPLGTWQINDSVETQSTWKAMFADNPQSIWVDNLSGSNVQGWVVTALGDNKYEITNPMAGIGKLGMAKTWQGAENTRLWLLDPSNDDLKDNDENLIYDGPCTTWAFVSADEYETLIGKIAAYNAAKNLKSVIDSAPANIDKSAAEAVYNNTSSTADELNTAAATLQQAILDYNATLASPENPQDLTSMLKNPHYETSATDGWSGTALVLGGTQTAEHYDKTYDTYQEVTGISDGIYKVNVSGFYRPGSTGAANTAWTNGDVSVLHAKVYAESGETHMENSLQNIVAGAIDVVGDVEYIAPDGTKKYYPNSMSSFSTWSQTHGQYQDNHLFIPVENGSLKVGIKKETGISTDWTIIDDWTITYYGNSVEAYKYWYNDVKTAIINDMNAQIAEDGSTKYYKPAQDEFKAFLATAEAASTKDEIKAATVGLTDVAANVLNSIKAYNNYVSKLETIREYMAEHDDIQGDDVDILADYIMDDEMEPNEDYPNGNGTYILTNCFLNTDEITAETEYLQTIYENAIKNGLSEGSDCTNMLTNASFKDGFTGWTKSAGNVGGLASFPDVECYETVVEVSQKVEGVPNGLYALSCKAFERPGANGSFDPEAESIVYLYMNNFQTQVQNVCKDAISLENAVDQENCYLNSGVADGTWPYDYEVEGYGIIPNSMDGASYAFQAGRYEQTVYGLVTDGTMTIGLTSNGKKLGTSCWVLWADFKLKYMAKNEEALTSVLSDMAKQAQLYMDENADNLTTPAAANLSAAIDAAGKAAGDVDEMWDALVVLNDALTAARANASAYATCTSEYDKLVTAIDDYSETASAEAVNNALEITTKYDSIIDMNTEEVTAFTVTINEAITALKIPNAEGASDDNPIDFSSVIVNGTFDVVGDFTGWSGSSFGAGGTTSTCAERYNMTFDTYQDIEGIPAGTYGVTVQAFYREGSSDNDYKVSLGDAEHTVDAYLYATTATDSAYVALPKASDGLVSDGLGGATATVGGSYVMPNTMEAAVAWFEAGYYKSNEVIVKVGEDGKLRIGVKKDTKIDTDWTIVDNFKLTYYGPNSQKNPTAIDVIGSDNKVSVSAIYNVAGQKVSTISKGINIIKMSDNSVRKIIVK